MELWIYIPNVGFFKTWPHLYIYIIYRYIHYIWHQQPVTMLQNSDLWLNLNVGSYLVCQRMFAHFLPGILDYIGDWRSPQLSCRHRLLFMNISSLYLDHSVFSGHTWSRAVDGESNTEVKVGCNDCIILFHCDTELQPAAKTSRLVTTQCLQGVICGLCGKMNTFIEEYSSLWA